MILYMSNLFAWILMRFMKKIRRKGKEKELGKSKSKVNFKSH